MKLLNRNVKLAVFDLDGTLINSTSLWGDIDKHFFGRRGMEIPENYGKDIAHVGLDMAAKITKEKYLPNEKEEDILNEWYDYASKAYQEDITIKENAKELLELLKENHVHIALATANAEELYIPCIKRLGIDSYFEFIIDPRRVKSGKSSVEIYDKVREHFNVDSEEVVIFEDLLEAIKTASKKYFVIGVYDEHSSKNRDSIKNYCHLFIKNFSEVIDLIKKEN